MLQTQRGMALSLAQQINGLTLSPTDSAQISAAVQNSGFDAQFHSILGNAISSRVSAATLATGRRANSTYQHINAVAVLN